MSTTPNPGLRVTFDLPTDLPPALAAWLAEGYRLAGDDALVLHLVYRSADTGEWREFRALTPTAATEIAALAVEIASLAGDLADVLTGERRLDA